MAEMNLEEYADQAGKGARLGKREGVRSMGGRRGLGRGTVRSSQDSWGLPQPGGGVKYPHWAG